MLLPPTNVGRLSRICETDIGGRSRPERTPEGEHLQELSLA